MEIKLMAFDEEALLIPLHIVEFWVSCFRQHYRISYCKLFYFRPSGQPCSETEEFDLIRNMLIAADEERFNDAGN